MPFNGTGTFVSLSLPDFPAVPGTLITAASFNANMNDIFNNGLTKCVTRDGQSPATANLPMGGFRHTNVSNAVADTDYAAFGQVAGLRGTIGATDWDSRISTGIYEATAASLAGPATNFPPTPEIGQLLVYNQGGNIIQSYFIKKDIFTRQRVAGVWSVWVSKSMIVGNSAGAANVAKVEFFESDGTTSRGYVGNDANPGSNLVVKSNVGDITLSPASDKVVPDTTGAVDLGTSSLTFRTAYVQGIQFPATQVSSADPNMLDDYEEGTFTPAISSAVVGNLTVVYSEQAGNYIKVGRIVHTFSQMITTTFTHTTASGDLIVTGRPFIGSNVRSRGTLEATNITYPAGRTFSFSRMDGNAQWTFGTQGSNVALATMQITDHATGVNISFHFTHSYTASA